MQLTSSGTANLFYDVNGNMTSDGTHSYAWDARNHLKQIDSGTTASFIYDPFGRRTSKTILSTQTGFLYDGVNPVQELSGTTVTANSLMGSMDEEFQRTDSVGARSFLTDALGSSIALADSSGTIQTQYTFDPFGNTTLSGSSTTNSLAYTGRELDSTGLYFYRARYYNPALQRFISEDPIELGGGDINLYAYTENSPTNYTDATGTSICLACAGLLPNSLTGRKPHEQVPPWLPLLGLVPGKLPPGASPVIQAARQATRGNPNVSPRQIIEDARPGTLDQQEPIDKMIDEVTNRPEAKDPEAVLDMLKMLIFVLSRGDIEVAPVFAIDPQSCAANPTNPNCG